MKLIESIIGFCIMYSPLIALVAAILFLLGTGFGAGLFFSDIRMFYP